MFPVATLDYMDTRKTSLDTRVLGKRVSDRRAELRLEQTEVAERAGLSRAYLSRLESGIVSNPKLFDLEAVAGALDVPLAALVGPGVPTNDVRMAQCADLMQQLEGEPPEVVETVLRWWRDSVQIAKGHKQAREN